MYYQLLKGYTVTEDGDGAVTYGVKVFDIASIDAPNKQTCIYENCGIAFTPEEMLCHIKLWNELQPSLPHLMDLIDDIINQG